MEVFIEDHPNGPWFKIDVIKNIKGVPTVVHSFGIGA